MNGPSDRAVGDGTARTTVRVKLRALGFLVVFCGLLVVAGAIFADWQYPRRAHDELTDPQLAQIIGADVERLGDAAEGVHLYPDGRADISVLFGMLSVYTDGNGENLEALCQTLAPTLVNPATGNSLGFTLVSVGSHDIDAPRGTCSPP